MAEIYTELTTTFTTADTEGPVTNAEGKYLDVIATRMEHQKF